MNTIVHDWGVRLSDRIRRALDAGDLAGASRLAREGDGHARSLEKEFTLMVKGLGITIHVLLDLLPGTVARLGGGADAASGRLVALLARFRGDLARLTGTAATDPRSARLEDAVAATGKTLDAAEARALEDQARLGRAVLAALDARDAAAARARVDEKEQRHWLSLHDRLIRFMAETFGLVLREGGPAALLRFHRETAEGQRRGFEKWEAMTAAEFAEATAFLLKQHMGDVEVREDDEKFTIVQRPCGSGGRLRLGGAYAGPDALPLVDAPGALTAGESAFPVYCSHCPVWNAVMPVEWFGRPHWVFDHPSQPDGSCTLHVYKRRDGAPAEYLRRLGIV